MAPAQLSTTLTEVSQDQLVVRGVPVRQIVGGCTVDDLICLLLGLDLDGTQRDVLRACLVVNCDHGRASNATTAAVAATATARHGVAAGVAAGLLAVGSATISPRDTMAFLGACVTARGDDGRELAAFARDQVRTARGAGRRIPGYGSPFHPDGDPRVAPLRAVAEAAGTWGDHGAMFDALGTALAAEGRSLPANEVGTMAACLADLGLDPDQGEAIAVIGVVPSLAANVILESQHPPRFIVGQPFRP